MSLTLDGLQSWTRRTVSSDGSFSRAFFGDIEVLLVSTPQTISIINSPERSGAAFQQLLAGAVTSTLHMLNGQPISTALHLERVDVVYLLRGGLNFPLHQAIAQFTGRDPEVSFLSSQRVADSTGFRIAENEYSKWSLQDESIVCIGDISATGTTMTKAWEAIAGEYANAKKAPHRLLVFTIGTPNLLTALTKALQVIRNTWPAFKGITVVYFEGLFSLYNHLSLLETTHLPYTDFLRKQAPRTLELERATFQRPLALLERCAIYDGGSRAFEPGPYLLNLISYWRRVHAIPPSVSTEQFLKAKTDMYNYDLDFEEWKTTVPQWIEESDEDLRSLYVTGQEVLRELSAAPLAHWAAIRLAELEPLSRTNV